MADENGISDLKRIFDTPRGRARLAGHFFVAFGAVAAVLLVAQLLGAPFAVPGVVLAISLVAGLLWGSAGAYPRRRISRRLPGVTITIRPGDLLAEETDLVIGCGDTFDADAGPLGRLHERDPERLDEELDLALSGVVPTSVETRESKPEGRLRRYPIGTIAVIGSPRRRIYCLACGRTGKDPSMDDLWLALSHLWASIDEDERVAVPVLGAELGLDREDLIKMIVLSFVARSRMRPVRRQLAVIVPPGEVGRVDLLELHAFLNAL